MEDLATDRIYRLMIAQRVLHQVEVDGVVHTWERVTRLFEEEVEIILSQLPVDADDLVRERYQQARELSERMIVRGEFDPI
jgi:malate synthase